MSIFSVDSNILIYAFDTANRAKHETSVTLLSRLEQTASPLAMQCLGEFYSVVSRKFFLTPSEASFAVTRFLETMPIITADKSDLTAAMALQQQHRIQFFDSLLVATLARARCQLLLSEDLHHEGRYGTVQVINPFRLPTAELDALLS